MRYVVVDLQGNQRDAFDSHQELVDELREGARIDLETLRGLYVLTQDDSGRQIGPTERGDELLDRAPAGSVDPSHTVLFNFMSRSVITVGASPGADPQYQEFRRLQTSSAAV